MEKASALIQSKTSSAFPKNIMKLKICKTTNHYTHKGDKCSNVGISVSFCCAKDHKNTKIEGCKRFALIPMWSNWVNSKSAGNSISVLSQGCWPGLTVPVAIEKSLPGQNQWMLPPGSHNPILNKLLCGTDMEAGMIRRLVTVVWNW